MRNGRADESRERVRAKEGERESDGSAGRQQAIGRTERDGEVGF